MISIVVSSYKEDLFSNFSANVKQTIGDIPFEIIQIKNPGLMGICEAYNKGGNLAKFPYLVFSHEDILFHTNNWGQILIESFISDPQIGLLGVAGSFYKAFFYSGWGLSEESSSSFMIGTHYGRSVLSKVKNGKSAEIILNESKSFPQNFIEPSIYNEQVAVLDGMFLATKKEIFQTIRFDEQTFKGFHCYDLDYSMQVGGKYKVVVSQNILIEHFSAGNFSKDWILNIKLFHKKWLRYLPCCTIPYTTSKKLSFEFLAIEQYLRLYKTDKKNIWRTVMPLYNYRYINLFGSGWFYLNYKLFVKLVKMAVNSK